MEKPRRHQFYQVIKDHKRRVDYTDNFWLLMWYTMMMSIFLSRMNSLSPDMRKGWADPDWGACYSMKSTFKPGMVITDREKLRNSSKLKEMKATWQVNAIKLCGLNPEKEGKKTFWIVREIWMRFVNYLVVLYQCWFSKLNGCFVVMWERFFISVTFEQYLGTMKHHVCILF